MFSKVLNNLLLLSMIVITVYFYPHWHGITLLCIVRLDFPTGLEKLNLSFFQVLHWTKSMRRIDCITVARHLTILNYLYILWVLFWERNETVTFLINCEKDL